MTLHEILEELEYEEKKKALKDKEKYKKCLEYCKTELTFIYSKTSNEDLNKLIDKIEEVLKDD